MLVAKYLSRTGKPQFAEVIKSGHVQFDVRPDWILLGEPIGRVPKKHLYWVHPNETTFVWIKEFSNT